MTPFEEYRKLEQELLGCRKKFPAGSSEEDSILDKMESTWWKLQYEEQELINAEPPKCWPEGT